MQSLEELQREYTKLLDLLAVFLLGIIVGAIITIVVLIIIGVLI